MRLQRFMPILACLFAGSTFAHSDLSKPIYVSHNGADDGRCEEISRPCASIGYAISQAGKGNQVRVATGTYELRDVGDIFLLVSGTLDIRGGYDFTTDSFSGQATTLIGVPAEYRGRLAERGFHVVSDRKGIPSEVVKQTNVLLKQRQQMQQGLKTAPCQSGTVNGLACDSVDLLGHVSLGNVSSPQSAGADIWGFVDLNTHREYAIMGYGAGTAVFDISDPENPREVGFVDGQSTIWRDIKVHQRYNSQLQRWDAFAYVTTDGVGDGLFVLDLTALPQAISRASYSSDFSEAHNVFSLNTDYATGLSIKNTDSSLIIAGSNNGTGIFRSYSLNSALPSFSAMPDSGESICVSDMDGCYMHDAASMIIDDSRMSQCPNATSYCEVLFDFNENAFVLWDVTDPASPVRLSTTPYTNSAYTHSGWPTEDKMSLFVHDEIDERRFGLNTTVRTFSIADLAAPTALGVYTGANNAIDHNGFVRGNRYYMSNYADGLTVLDITDPANPIRAGFLDTFPSPAGADFVGAWGAYPFFPSGLIAISDIDSGLYIAEDQTLDVAQGTLSFSSVSYGVSEGATANLTVNRSGGSSGAVTVEYELLNATTDDNDITVATGTLSWADGETTAQTIAIDALADGSTESLEQLIVHLVAPTGGATLSAPATSNLYISDSGATASVGFSTDTISTAERGFATAVAVIQRSGSAEGAVSTDWAVNAGTATPGSDFSGATSGTVSWADGDATPKSIEFQITDDGSAEPTEDFTIELSNISGGSVGSNAISTVSIRDGDGANAAPVANAGSGSTATAGTTVTLDGSASSDPDGDTLSFAWTQTMGPAVSLNGGNTDTASFTAPSLSSDTLLTFQLQVSDPSGESDLASVSVTISRTAPPASSGGGGGGGGGVPGPLLLALMAAVLIRRVTRTGVA